MTDIQSSHCATVAMNVNGISFIRAESGPLTEDSHCTLKVLTVFWQMPCRQYRSRLQRDGPQGRQCAYQTVPARYVCPDPQTLPPPETRAESSLVIQAASVSDSAWWRFARRPKVNKKPNHNAMMIDFLFHGCIHLPEGHPQYEERKALLLRKGFHFQRQTRRLGSGSQLGSRTLIGHSGGGCPHGSHHLFLSSSGYYLPFLVKGFCITD